MPHKIELESMGRPTQKSNLIGIGGSRHLGTDMSLKLNDKIHCLPCAAQDHWLCFAPRIDRCCCVEEETTFENVENVKSEKGGYQKSQEAITDVTSTGRKRAAVMYPITEGMICEWSELANAGGGVIPIYGCFRNPATAIHHGPDKSTLNNSAENVHRICADCHNRWHSANDPYYGERPPHGEPFLPIDNWYWIWHDAETKATPEQLITAATGGWKSREAVKVNARHTGTLDSQEEPAISAAQ